MSFWRWPWTSGPSVFGSSTTAEEVTQGVDASNLTAIVTGATSGIGKETTRVLAMRGAKVIIPTRTKESGMKVKETILQHLPHAKLDVMEMDLSSLRSIISFVKSFDKSYKHLNILINNAGIMGCPYRLSKDGIDLQFTTNHLGHFLLTNLVLDKMKTTANETGVQGRIVNVSSLAHEGSDVSWLNLSNINDQKKYNSFLTYSRSKLANILHANELSKHLQAEGANVTANSLHPGIIFTNIFHYLPINSAIIFAASFLAKPFLKTIEQGAATSCYLALHPNIEGVTGKYFTDCNEMEPSLHAKDENLAKNLWEFSMELVNRSKK